MTEMKEILGLASQFIKEKAYTNETVLVIIGRDGNRKFRATENLLSGALAYSGANIILLGIAGMDKVQEKMKKYGADYGVYINDEISVLGRKKIKTFTDAGAKSVGDIVKM